MTTATKARCVLRVCLCVCVCVEGGRSWWGRGWPVHPERKRGGMKDTRQQARRFSVFQVFPHPTPSPHAHTCRRYPPHPQVLPTPTDLIDTVRDIVKELGLTLVIEPGRSMVATGSALVNTVTGEGDSGAPGPPPERERPGAVWVSVKVKGHVLGSCSCY